MTNTVATTGEGHLYSKKFTLGVMALGHMVNDWVAGTVWILAPAIAASMGLGPAEVGLILTVYGLAAGLIYIPAGILADRVPKPGLLLMISFWWVAIGYFCASFAPGFWSVTLLLAFGVMGDALWHPVATGVLVKRMPTQRAQVLGIHAMGGSLGAEILGPLSAGFLLGFFDWQTSLQILVIPAVIMGFVFIPMIGGLAAAPRSKISMSGIKSLIKDWSTPKGMGMVLMMISYNMSLYGILAMTPLVLQIRYGLNPFITSVVFASMLLVGTLFQPFVGKLSDRLGRRNMIIGIIFVAAVSVLGAAFVSSFWVFVSCLVVTTSLLTAVRPIILAAAVEFSGQSESTTLGLVFAILDGVGALGALIAGYAGEIDLSYAYLLAAILAFMSVATAMALKFNPGKAHAA